MMKRMSFSETIFLFFLALVIFGPKKLPEIARQVGKYLNEFKRASNEFKAQIEQEIAQLEVEKPTILPPTSAPLGATSRTMIAESNEVIAAELVAGVDSASVDSNDEPLFATSAAVTAPTAAPSEGSAASDAVTSSPSQESHA